MSSEAPENLEQPGGSQAAAGPPAEVAPTLATVPDSRLPTRKDTTLREFIKKMDEYAPIVSSCLRRFSLKRPR